MANTTIEEFSCVKECTFENERYSVRDNGSVFRHTPAGKRPRAADNQWTFGKENSGNPYLHLSGARIHRIVATAFLGDPPDPKYVVDHIDTNCRNNRPENLRWLTRLENTLKNPVTRKKIEYYCGSVEAFLENPSMLNEVRGEPNFTWMRTVTREEAQNCKARMEAWATSKTSNQQGPKPVGMQSSFAQRVYRPFQRWEVFGREPGLDLSATPWCGQYMWRATSRFPSSPNSLGDSAIAEYHSNLRPGAKLATNENGGTLPELTVLHATLIESKASILAMCECTNGTFAVVGIEIGGKIPHFIHFNLGQYKTKDEADTAFAKAINSNDWMGFALPLPSKN